MRHDGATWVRKPSGRERIALAKKRKQGDGFDENTAPTWTRFNDLLPDDFDEKVRRHREIVDLEAALRAEKEEISAEIDAFIQLTEGAAIRVGGLVALRVRSTTERRIKYEKLVARGVATDDIDASMEGGKEYYYVQVKVSPDPEAE